MRRFILYFIHSYILIQFVSAYDLALPNYKGDTIFYEYINDSTEVMVVSRTENYRDAISYIADTLFIPDTITYNRKKHIVTDIQPLALGMSKISVLVLPKTLNGRKYYESYQMGVKLSGSFVNNEDYNLLTSIEVDEENPFFRSIDGTLYTANRDTLLFYPPRKEGATYHVLEGTRYIGFFAFIGCPLLDSIVMPESLVDVNQYAFVSLEKVKTLRFPNSITRFSQGLSIYGVHLDAVIFGSGLTHIGSCTLGNGIAGEEIKRIVCLAVTPPTLTNLYIQGLEHITLYVPRKSISAYQQHTEWNKFYAIEPIEPPVVAGLNEAEISWVTSAEASSYSLTVYLDEAQTRRLVTLTFDERGYLTSMDFNPDVMNAPPGMPTKHVRQIKEQGEEGPSDEFNAYLSFTITGLKPATTYYFVRRTFNALGEVIDEETGSFETLGDDKENIDNVQRDDVRCTKELRDGTLYIRRSDGTVFDALGQALSEH